MSIRSERSVWEALAIVASGQHGLLTKAQLDEHLTRHQVRRRAQRGLLVPCAPGVWRLPSSPVTWEQHVMGCCLAGGELTAASHTCAGVLWGFEGLKPGTIHVTCPRNRSRDWSRQLQTGRYPHVVHGGAIERADIVPGEGVPRTQVARTIVDMASQLSPQLLASITDDALRRHLLTLDQLSEARERRSTHGITRLDRIIARRSETGVGESKWEDLVWDWIVAAGLPAPVRQYPVRLPSRAARIDLAYPEYKIAIEFDGYVWHGTRQQFDRDRVRSNELSRAGWLIVSITSSLGRARTVDAVRQALGSRGWVDPANQ